MARLVCQYQTDFGLLSSVNKGIVTFGILIVLKGVTSFKMHMMQEISA